MTTTNDLLISSTRNYVRSKLWDSFWFQSAYWIFPLFFLIFAIGGENGFKTYAAIVFIATRLSHIYFSMYLCLAHPAYQEVKQQSKLRFYIIPAAIVAVFTLFFITPDWLIPADPALRLKIYVFVTFPYVYYHYALQHYGILSMYRGRAGQIASSGQLWFEKAYCHITTSLVISALTLKNFYDVKLGSFSFGTLFMVEKIDWNMVAWLVLIPLTIIFIYRELRLSNPSLPKLFYAVSMSLMSVVLTLDSFFLSWMLLDMQHTLAIFGLGGHILANYETEVKKVDPQKALIKQYSILVLVSAVCAVIHYYFNANGVQNKEYGALFGNILPQAQPGQLQLFFYGFFIALGIVHYYYDRLAFRFSDPKIGPVARRLLNRRSSSEKIGS